LRRIRGARAHEQALRARVVRNGALWRAMGLSALLPQRLEALAGN
jgi:hypothetical protein